MLWLNINKDCCKGSKRFDEKLNDLVSEGCCILGIGFLNISKWALMEKIINWSKFYENPRRNFFKFVIVFLEKKPKTPLNFAFHIKKYQNTPLKKLYETKNMRPYK